MTGLVRALTLALHLTFCLLAGAGHGQTAADRARLSAGVNTEIWVDWRAVSEMDDGFLAVYPDYPRHMPPGIFADLRRQGIDFIRIAADPAPLLAHHDTPLAAHLRTQLRQRVAEVQAAGLTAILDLHAFPRWDGYGVDWVLENEAQFSRYLAMVEGVAKALDGLPPERTLFQPMNEPTQDCEALETGAAQGWPARLQRLHAAARSGAPDLPIVLSGACWGGAFGLAALDPGALGDDNLFWSFHSYDPFTYSHQSAAWTGSILMFLQGVPYPASRLTQAMKRDLVLAALRRARASDSPLAPEATPQALMALLEAYQAEGDDAAWREMERAAAWADAHGLPRNRILHDEFGAIWALDDGTPFGTQSQMRYLADKVGAARRLGFAWGLWSWTGSMRFGVKGGYALDPQICAVMGLQPC